MISLRNRLALSYALFICVSVLVMGFIINRFAEKLFSAFVTENINTESREIADTIAEQWDPNTGSFDVISVEAMGMYFVHQGYIVSVVDIKGEIVWDARACDMQQCAMVINEIIDRMENEFGVGGSFQTNQYHLAYQDVPIGFLNIDTYGPFFYSKTESAFLSGLNNFLLVSGGIFIILSILLSVFLAAEISRPVLRASEAARRIACGELSARVSDRYGTRELRELSRSVNDLAAALENGERWQKQLTADIAHELRTPLTCLQGNMEAMIDGVWEPTAERLSSAYEEISRLNKLVEDLNRLSILEQKNLILHKTECDLTKLAGAAVERFRPAALEKGIEIKLLSPAVITVNADYDRLTQVFTNLISNALKYTDLGSITVTLSETQQYCEVSVADTGIGMEADELPHIFERFYRSDKSRNRNTGGAGIGLSIVQTIVNAHGGQIQAESRTGKGSVFMVRLPREVL
ncbi:HAMP domain-containing histidine kinase [Treponema primitia]|uniref:sensor histidine kinase n=1 Tax=Treponema primitia TaxID=88058 RepID=UPI003980C50F